MKLAIGNDHAAVEMKKEIKAYLEGRGIEVIDVGTDSPQRFNYPLSGYRAAKLVASGRADGGVLICGTGVGISLAKMIVDAWLEARFEGGRHQERIDMIQEIEDTQGLRAADEL